MSESEKIETEEKPEKEIEVVEKEIEAPIEKVENEPINPQRAPKKQLSEKQKEHLERMRVKKDNLKKETVKKEKAELKALKANKVETPEINLSITNILYNEYFQKAILILGVIGSYYYIFEPKPSNEKSQPVPQSHDFFVATH
jgi:hypothetical protein